MNVYELAVEHDVDDPPGYQGGGVRLGALLGASLLGMTLYELPPGNRICPYHYEYGNEEWLLVVAGAPTLRTPDGERELREGDLVAFPAGPEGAHTVENRSEEPVRVAIFSTLILPAISVYPNSGKIGVRPGVEEDTLDFRRGDAVDYWEGE